MGEHLENENAKAKAAGEIGPKERPEQHKAIALTVSDYPIIAELVQIGANCVEKALPDLKVQVKEDDYKHYELLAVRGIEIGKSLDRICHYVDENACSEVNGEDVKTEASNG